MGKIQVWKEGASESEEMPIDEDSDNLEKGSTITDPKGECWKITDCDRTADPRLFRIQPTQHVHHHASNESSNPH